MGIIGALPFRLVRDLGLESSCRFCAEVEPFTAPNRDKQSLEHELGRELYLTRISLLLEMDAARRTSQRARILGTARLLA